jgi:outer membrane protein TolC
MTPWLTRATIQLALSTLLAGCATYSELPLPERPSLAADVASLRHEGAVIAPRLSVEAISLLALENSPDLVAVRAQAGVSRAQLLQAGLPPNPSVTGAFLPLLAGIPPTLSSTHAFNAGLSYDIRSLITLHNRRMAAHEAADQVNAQILWQEWQTVGQARLFAVDLIEVARTLALFRQTRQLLADRNAHSQAALANGNTTLSVAAPDLAALQSAITQTDSLERLQLSRRHQLAALLGLEPDAPFELVRVPELPQLDRQRVLALLPTIADRRPDLVALRLGYLSEDARLRGAILNQFPNLSIGVVGGSDNSNIRNIGPQITLDLPVFDHNQGGIAFERATRRQLHDEYLARLDASVGQIRALLTENDLLEQQLDRVKRDRADVDDSARRAQAAFAAGNIDERSAVDLISARLTKEAEIVSLEQSLLESHVAIATLVGAGMRPVSLPPEIARGAARSTTARIAGARS